MWGDSIVGFGSYHYRYKSGREGDWPLTGFSPRKRDLTLYVMAGFDRYGALMRRLGKYRTGKSCLYIKTLADIDLDGIEGREETLSRVFDRSWASFLLEEAAKLSRKIVERRRRGASLGHALPQPGELSELGIARVRQQLGILQQLDEL